MEVLDFRSDTLTKPTKQMRERMADASVGDDFYGEDPTIRMLEERAALLLGKESALFVLSGTMANLVAIRAQVAPGSAAIVSASSHLHLNETGHLASIGGITSHPQPTPGGHFDLKALAKAYPVQKSNAKPSVLAPKLKAICIENTHNGEGGRCLGVHEMRLLADFANNRDLVFHMDGARLFNAAVALNCSPSDLVSPVDSVSFCLSKGLAAPGGAVLAASEDVINEARHWRQMVGGGMRQAGILAAAGLMALENNIERLSEDHDNAKLLAVGLREAGLNLTVDDVETNIVMAYLPESLGEPDTFHSLMRDIGVLTLPPKGNRFRFVTHRDVTRVHVEKAIQHLARLVSQVTEEMTHV
ncbi:aminotransferase class I/II-fold pyridoxal phosphate-dependent enzyme [Roseovarius aestuarii]|nr:aminotransferase class I/II-fold pyridoxal phosphate-dependent enzyme [Roseovarius aestuarii]